MKMRMIMLKLSFPLNSYYNCCISPEKSQYDIFLKSCSPTLHTFKCVWRRTLSKLLGRVLDATPEQPQYICCSNKKHRGDTSTFL